MHPIIVSEANGEITSIKLWTGWEESDGYDLTAFEEVLNEQHQDQEETTLEILRAIDTKTRTCQYTWSESQYSDVYDRDYTGQADKDGNLSGFACLVNESIEIYGTMLEG